MVTDLVLIQKIGTQLEKRRKPEENIFPLTPTHRKELRELKQKNIGNLREQLRALKQIKKDEYEKKYLEELKQELQTHIIKIEKLNEDWDNRVAIINKLIQERAELERQTDVTCLNFSTDYGDLANLNDISLKRKAYLDIEKKSKEILNKEFEEQYGLPFKQVDEQIDDLATKYEESINFGDLELVKKLYYLMKKSDRLFQNITRMKV